MKIAAIPTQIDSFHHYRGAGYSAAQRTRIVDFIERMGGDWSIGELAAALDMDKSAVSGRVNEALYDTHQLVAMPERRDRVSGRMVRPVGLPSKQFEMFALKA